jgi:hypothetical protein
LVELTHAAGLNSVDIIVIIRLNDTNQSANTL